MDKPELTFQYFLDDNFQEGAGSQSLGRFGRQQSRVSQKDLAVHFLISFLIGEELVVPVKHFFFHRPLRQLFLKQGWRESLFAQPNTRGRLEDKPMLLKLSSPIYDLDRLVRETFSGDSKRQPLYSSEDREAAEALLGAFNVGGPERAWKHFQDDYRYKEIRGFTEVLTSSTPREALVVRTEKTPHYGAFFFEAVDKLCPYITDRPVWAELFRRVDASNLGRGKIAEILPKLRDEKFLMTKRDEDYIMTAAIIAKHWDIAAYTGSSRWGYPAITSSIRTLQSAEIYAQDIRLLGSVSLHGVTEEELFKIFSNAKILELREEIVSLRRAGRLEEIGPLLKTICSEAADLIKAPEILARINVVKDYSDVGIKTGAFASVAAEYLGSTDLKIIALTIMASGLILITVKNSLARTTVARPVEKELLAVAKKALER